MSVPSFQVLVSSQVLATGQTTTCASGMGGSVSILPAPWIPKSPAPVTKDAQNAVAEQRVCGDRSCRSQVKHSL